MPYLNVAQVENALSTAAAPPYSAFTQLITLPNASWEGRIAHALKLGSAAGTRPALLLLGGVHAREWGSADILVYFVEQLQSAFLSATGITLGGKSFTAAQIAAIVNKLHLYVFPQVNPDGRQYSFTVDGWWRKNRRPAPMAQPNCPGVDLNRNHDFLWNYPVYYSPMAAVRSSTDPCTEIYIGPSAASEPETTNVVWMMDSFPDIRVLIDLHSFSEDILYVWGDDEDQNADPAMNFQNPAYNGQRGIVGDLAYREYLESCDQTAAVALATRMHDALAAVRGKNYTVEQALSLYPTSGTGHDYSFCRHLVSAAKSKVYGYTIEWGLEFQPAYAEMQNIMQDITAALLESCLAVIDAHADVYIRDNVGDTGAVPSGGVFWESPDIVVRQHDDNVFSYEPAKRNQDNYVYVRVTNLGPASATGVQVTLRAVRYPGTEFVFPFDWTAVDADHVAPTAIGASWPSIPAGGSQIAKFTLSAVEVETLYGWDAANFHPCLLADVRGCNDYGAPVGAHVWQDNNLGQKNISVVDADLDTEVIFPFVIGHPSNRDEAIELLIDRGGLPHAFAVSLHPSERVRGIDAGLGIVGGVTATILDPTRVRVTSGGFEGTLSLVAGTTWRAESQLAAARLAEFAPGPPSAAIQVAEARMVVSLRRAPGDREALELRVHVPARAEAGAHTIRIAQRQPHGRVVGGVSLELRIRLRRGARGS